ncbi:MAG: molecular chaperone TorD family protein [bacterium]
MELFRALAAFTEPPAAEHARLTQILRLPGPPSREEYTKVFLFELYPYASVYLGDEGMMGGDARDRAAGVWRVLKQVPPAEPDHLAALLALYATLAEWEEAEADPAARLLRRQTRKALLWEHLTCWLFPYLDKMEEIATPAYRGWGRLLRSALYGEIEALGLPDKLPLHLREAPALPHPKEHGMDAFLQGLLAPARSGLILVRADLARGARDLGLGIRMGERKFALRELLSQDPAAIFGWLEDYAHGWAGRHGRLAGVTGDVSRFWTERAEMTVTMLRDLRGQTLDWLERSFPVEKGRATV